MGCAADVGRVERDDEMCEKLQEHMRRAGRVSIQISNSDGEEAAKPFVLNVSIDERQAQLDGHMGGRVPKNACSRWIAR